MVSPKLMTGSVIKADRGTGKQTNRDFKIASSTDLSASMATISPTRPSRRAASRRKVVVEESDDEIMGGMGGGEDDGEDFTPAPQRSPRRQTRRKTSEVPSTQRTTARSRRARTGDSVEPSEIFDPNEPIKPEPVSPTKKASPRKRKSAAPTKGARSSVALDAVSLLPTPKPSTSPEPSQLHGAPLADITDSLNEQAPTPRDQKDFVAIKALDTILEKPMDIVVRSRALAVPQQPENAGPKPRTVIQYLVLKNFKSYAGRQEVGPFHASFSSVVGPNGSGKSNVIDSLLFVFGFRASKMRQGKISALIHNSAAFPDLDHCEVEVHFQEVMDLVRSNPFPDQITTNVS